MKKTVLLLAALAALTFANAETFKLKRGDIDPIAGAILALDGYEKAYDQGPGNPVKIIRVNYSLEQDARSKLAANLVVLRAAATAVSQKMDDFRREAAGVGFTYNPGSPAHRAAFEALAAPWLQDVVEIQLSPITDAELRAGLESEGRNPIPPSVHERLLQLRTQQPPK